MNNYEVDVTALSRAQGELGEQLDHLRRHLNAARDLINSVPPSTASKPDLVANKMHEVYRDAADSDTGVRGVLEDYVAEIEDMVALIDATAKAYQSHDDNAARRIRMIYGGEGR